MDLLEFVQIVMLLMLGKLISEEFNQHFVFNVLDSQDD